MSFIRNNPHLIWCALFVLLLVSIDLVRHPADERGFVILAHCIAVASGLGVGYIIRRCRQ